MYQLYNYICICTYTLQYEQYNCARFDNMIILFNDLCKHLLDYNCTTLIYFIVYRNNKNICLLVKFNNLVNNINTEKPLNFIHLLSSVY